jgi:predicted DCC family thiol-disulfide oxidoreductase YuxK
MDAPLPSILLFDGHCNLCSGTVRFILKRDRKRRFRYAPLGGPSSVALLAGTGLDIRHMDSFVLSEDGGLWQRSTAALRIARQLDGAWPILYAFIIVPRPVRDAVYDFISRNRYRWFGKRETCWLPRKEWEPLFPDGISTEY